MNCHHACRSKVILFANNNTTLLIYNLNKVKICAKNKGIRRQLSSTDLGHNARSRGPVKQRRPEAEQHSIGMGVQERRQPPPAWSTLVQRSRSMSARPSSHSEEATCRWVLKFMGHFSKTKLASVLVPSYCPYSSKKSLIEIWKGLEIQKKLKCLHILW